MFKETSLVSDPNAFFTVHPFKRYPGKAPFTMVGCERRNKKSDYILFIDHEKKVIFKVPQGLVSCYGWPKHNLYFISGVDGIYTAVHENLTTNEIKVPCCYGNPDYLVSGTDPNIKLLAIIEHLGWPWYEVSVECEASPKIMELVHNKIKEQGWYGGKVFN